jgi:uncharacterized protein (UPF0548 family)
MFLLSKPTKQKIENFINTQGAAQFSYKEVGATGGSPPPHYTLDHNRVYLGSGPETFERAKAAMRRWEMFNIGWLQLCWPYARLETGSTVAILARALGLWSLNAARIVYLVEQSGDIERFGFAYGTLPDHIERGEERFCVEWWRADGSVWYDLLAFSQPNRLLAQLAYPYVRRLQKRFAADSKQAMLKAIK